MSYAFELHDEWKSSQLRKFSLSAILAQLELRRRNVELQFDCDAVKLKKRENFVRAAVLCKRRGPCAGGVRITLLLPFGDQLVEQKPPISA